MVMKGSVEISKAVNGKKVVIDVIKEGELFGEISFIDKQPRSATATAVGDTAIGIFDKDYLIEQYNKLPNNFRELFDAMAYRIRRITLVAAKMALKK